MAGKPRSGAFLRAHVLPVDAGDRHGCLHGIAAEGLARFPDNVLLRTFVEKFSRMGLLPK